MAQATHHAVPLALRQGLGDVLKIGTSTWLAIAVGLAGCSQPFVREQRLADLGTVYVYRPSKFRGGPIPIVAALVGSESRKFSLENGRYLALQVPPGSHSLAFFTAWLGGVKHAEVPLSVVVTDDIFVRCSLEEPGGSAQFAPVCAVVPASTAEPELSGCRKQADEK